MYSFSNESSTSKIFQRTISAQVWRERETEGKRGGKERERETKRE